MLLWTQVLWRGDLRTWGWGFLRAKPPLSSLHFTPGNGGILKKINVSFVASGLVQLLRGITQLLTAPRGLESLTPFTVLNSENRKDRQKQTKAGIILGYSTLAAHLKITVHKGLGFGVFFYFWKWKVLFDFMIWKFSTSQESLFSPYRCLSSCFFHDHPALRAVGIRRLGSRKFFWDAQEQAGLQWAVAAQQALSCTGKG